MRILLPPSEAKRPGGTGPAIGAGDTASAASGASDFDTSRLVAPRRLVATALIDFCRRDPVAAAGALSLPARTVEADLAADRAVFEAPTMPALDRYAGTVYEGLDAATLTPAARRRALAAVLTFSGLFGVVAASERIPAYRLPVAAVLPAVGALTPFWRTELRTEMADLTRDELIVDLRSSDYAAMWRATGSARDQVVTVRVVTEQPGGRLAVISYPSKYGKGRLARAIVSSRARITSATQLAELWIRAGGRDAFHGADGVLELVTQTATKEPA